MSAGVGAARWPWGHPGPSMSGLRTSWPSPPTSGTPTMVCASTRRSGSSMPTDPLDGLRKVFDKPAAVPRSTGAGHRSPRRYSRDAQDTALFMAQLSFSDLVPHRLLVGPEIQEYVNEVLVMPWPRWRSGWQWPVIVEIVPGLTPENGTAEFVNGRMYVRRVES